MPKNDLIYLKPEAVMQDSGLRSVGSEQGEIAALGDSALLRRGVLAFFCSAKCPGRLILETYDLAQKLRRSQYVVAGGFHTPMEKECLSILLVGPAPVIVCPARSIDNMRLPKDWSRPMEEGRLLVLSPFDDKHKRVTAQTSQVRNEFVAAIADKVFMAHAASGGKTEALASKVVACGKPLLTVAGEENANLLTIGAIAVDEQSLSLRSA